MKSCVLFQKDKKHASRVKVVSARAKFLWNCSWIIKFRKNLILIDIFPADLPSPFTPSQKPNMPQNTAPPAPHSNINNNNNNQQQKLGEFGCLVYSRADNARACVLFGRRLEIQVMIPRPCA